MKLNALDSLLTKVRYVAYVYYRPHNAKLDVKMCEGRAMLN